MLLGAVDLDFPFDPGNRPAVLDIDEAGQCIEIPADQRHGLFEDGGIAPADFELDIFPDRWPGLFLSRFHRDSGDARGCIEDLLEAILLVTDTTEIKANPTGRILGTVIEGELDKSKGVVATILVQNGTLKVGDVIAMGASCGRIRAMFDYQGNAVEEALPSTPVSILGLSDVPMAG